MKYVKNKNENSREGNTRKARATLIIYYNADVVKFHWPLNNIGLQKTTRGRK